MTPPGWYRSIIAAPAAEVVPWTVGMNNWPTFSAVLIRRRSATTGSGLGLALGVVRLPAAVRRAGPLSERTPEPPQPDTDAVTVAAATAARSRSPPVRL